MPASHSMRLPGSRPGSSSWQRRSRYGTASRSERIKDSIHDKRKLFSSSCDYDPDANTPGSVTARSGGQNVRAPTTSCRLSYSPRAFQKPQCQLFRPCLWRLLYRPPPVLLLYGRHSKGYLLWLRDYERSLLL